jgi:hypothetical protein
LFGWCFHLLVGVVPLGDTMPTKSGTRKVDLRFAEISTSSLLGPRNENYGSPLGGFGNAAFTRTDDGPVKGYLRRIARGDNATSELTAQQTNFDIKRGRYLAHYYNKADKRFYMYARSGLMADAGLPASPSSTDVSLTDDQAKVGFAKRAREAQNSFQGGTFLGELREALHMIKHPAQAFRKGFSDYFRTLKKRRRGSPSHRSKVLSDTWLEYVFGWKPLLSDIDSAAKALGNLAFREPFKMVSFYAKNQVPTQNKARFSGNVGPLVWHEWRQEYRETVVIYRGVVDCKIDGGAGDIRRDFGLTLEDFVPTLWELIPYSFVADYFTNIGDIISAFSYGGMNLRWTSRTQVIKAIADNITADAKLNSTDPINIIEFGNDPGRSVITRRIVERKNYTAGFVPSLRFEIPGANSTKWVNLLALKNGQRRLTPF